MKPASNKAKGRRLQQWTRDIVLKLFDELHPDDVRSTPMGVQGEDVQLSPKAREYLPIQIQCKNKHKYAVYPDFDEAMSHGKHIPVLIIKQDHRDPLAVVDAAWFFRLLRKLNGDI